MSQPDQRLPGIDALKGLACMLIIWHHLAFYGPMSDVLYPWLPELTDWLYGYGRMAVQVFLVVGGFLAASSLAPQGMAAFGSPGRLVLRRYQRLVLPYAVALVMSVLVAALVRPWFDNPSVPAEPTLLQFLAHLLLLQDVLGQEALSAGVWYVAIDFQLFALSVLIFSLARQFQRRLPAAARRLVSPGVGLVALLAASSMFFFNGRSDLDSTGLYFFGSYALGMMAFWASQAKAHRGWWLLAIAVLGISALALDFRGRLLVALLGAFGLVWLHRSVPWQQHSWWSLRLLATLGKMSYSIFLVHFSVCLLVNALVSHFWPTDIFANALGLLVAFGLSVGVGRVMYRNVESRRKPFSESIKALFVQPAV